MKPLILLKMQYFLLKQKLDKQSERERISFLAMVISILFAIWFFGVYNLQVNALTDLQKQIQATETAPIKLKLSILQAQLQSPNTTALLAQHKQLSTDITNLENQVVHHNQHVISSEDLDKLLHEMLQQTYSVSIVDFATVQQSTPTTVPASQANLEASSPIDKVHYRLVLKGRYFPIINYLKRLEDLSWHLYWDKMDYRVSKYPEGIAVIEFYTLKPKNVGGHA